jgi:hypothetical protein
MDGNFFGTKVIFVVPKISIAPPSFFFTVIRVWGL